jgi:hypothetical protein
MAIDKGQPIASPLAFLFQSGSVAVQLDYPLCLASVPPDTDEGFIVDQRGLQKLFGFFRCINPRFVCKPLFTAQFAKLLACFPINSHDPERVRVPGILGSSLKRPRAG